MGAEPYTSRRYQQKASPSGCGFNGFLKVSKRRELDISIAAPSSLIRILLRETIWVIFRCDE
jgi:hypothetical protein